MIRLLPVIAALMLPATPAMAERVSVLVFDASGSMWNRVEGDLTRIEVARDVMGDYFASRDGAVPLSVIAYGHNRRGDCSDIEVIAPLGQTAPGTLESRLRGLMPRGMTPLTDSLRMARSQIPPTAEAADIILVTDGLETCAGDPCALAAELAAEGIDIRAHVVGFGLTRLEVEALSCITDQTGGMLFQTNSGAELADALQQVSAVQPAPGPEPVVEPDPSPPEAAFDISDKAEAGFTYNITWRGEAGSTDYLGFVPLGEDQAPSSPGFGPINVMSGGVPRNPVTRTAPKEPGMYDLIIRAAGGVITARQAVEVVPPAMGFDPIGSVEPGSRIPITFRGPEQVGELIVIADIDQPVNEHQRYDWAYSLSRGGSVGLRAPSDPGEYELRYLNPSRTEVMFGRRFGVGIPFDDADLTTSSDLAAQAAAATQGEAAQDNIAAVPATFRLPSGVPQSDVTWDAVPLDPDMSPEAWAPTDSGPVISGTFEPGRWRVTATAPGEVDLSAEVEIFPGQVNDFTVQVQRQVQAGGEEDHGTLMDGPWRVLAVPPRDAPAGAATEVMDMLRITLRTRADANGWDGTFTPTPMLVGPQAPLDSAALDSATEEEGTLFVRFQLPAVSPEAFVISLAPYGDGYSGTMVSGPNSLPVVVWPEAVALPSLAALQDQLYGPDPEGDRQGSLPAPATQSMGCDEAICQRVNFDHGLEAQVPRGWMMWQVEHVDGAVTAQFTNGTDVLMLMGNAVWPPEYGPCLPTAAGPLCYWSNASAEAQIAAAFIAANTRLTGAEAGQGVTISLPTEPVFAGTDGYFPVTLTGPPGFQGRITMTRADAPDGPALLSEDAGHMLRAQDQVLPVPDQPGRYEVRITDAGGTLAATAVFEVLGGDAGESVGSMAIEPDDGARFVGRGPYLAGAEVLVQINRGQDKRGSDRVVVLAGGTDHALPDQGAWLDEFRASIRMPDAPGRYLLAVFDTESTSFRALTEVEVATSPVPELRHFNPNPAVRRPYSVSPRARMAMADRLAIVDPGGAVVAEASLYEVVTGEMRIPDGTSGPHELQYLAGGQVLAREKLDVGGPPVLVPSGGSDGPAELTMEGDLVPGGMVRVSVRGMIPPQATAGFIGADKPDRTILETGSRVTPDALEVEVKVPEKPGPWVLRLIDQNLIRVAEVVPGGASPAAPAATGGGTIIPIDLGTLSPEEFRARLRPGQP
ncbi:MAG: VWA domain-containing protein [Pseudotabrizicola sp.]|uniref:vWA domain-containing protein n=1 Tax=Pseudotabrizicola sp. TaxID=2939647 RepID=UPI0027160B9B|nr:VWA domain-containing protein [Pseudotabrizicola sp.]MDO9639946.1 VWA domain-containing protein [Pseudotabrizicola sp.]